MSRIREDRRDRSKVRPHWASRRVTASASVLASCLIAACNEGRSEVTAEFPPTVVKAFVSGEVWIEVDCNGTRGVGEPGIQQAQVRLVSATEELVVGLTDAQGFYRLSADVAPGERYEVVVDPVTVPTGLQPFPNPAGGDIQVTIDVAVGPGEQIFAGNDFAYCATSASTRIGDRVWHDLDCDGTQDAGEPGIDDVVVWLRDPQGNVIQETTTGPSNLGLAGHYEFRELTPGENYVVEVDQASLPAGFVAAPCEQGTDRTTDSNCSPAAVVAIGPDPTVDFGFCSTFHGEIGDYVWLDVNGDGLQNFGELDRGIDDVTVRLLDRNGQLLRKTRTRTLALPGQYRFTGLPAGSYIVEIDTATLPTGYLPTTCRQGSDPERDNNCSPAKVLLATDQSVDHSIDFGFVSPFTASIGDFVWNDLDCDGIQDPGEPGLPGVRVSLQDAAGALLAADFTDTAGRYEFVALPAGTYRVEVDATTLPSFYVVSPCEVGTDPSIDSNCSPAIVELVHGRLDDTIDFGFCLVPPGSIGDFVWDDLDCDGIQDPGEPGLPDVLVQLKDDSGTVIAMQATGAAGNYTFPGLMPGTYSVKIDPTTLPNGYVASPCQVGSDPAVDSNCSPAPVTLTPTSPTDDTIDFGFHPPTGSIGDFVWNDLNGDGLLTAGEPGIAGVQILLKTVAGAPLASTVTDLEGRYLFDGLCAGTYKVEYDPATVPLGSTPSPCEVGLNRAIDSNCSPTLVVLPTNSSTDLTIDFGFIPPP